MPDIEIDDNGLFEEVRRLNASLNSNTLEQLENQHAEIDKRWSCGQDHELVASVSRVRDLMPLDPRFMHVKSVEAQTFSRYCES
ncbi:hypothetical protein TNCV_77891 [Trichonephila clavipes]|nr:hypothetical protein TNCV_77891 [Trichonephila clavipes]